MPVTYDKLKAFGMAHPVGMAGVVGTALIQIA